MGVLATASLLAFGFILADSFKIEYVKEDQDKTSSLQSPSYITYKPIVRALAVNEQPAEDNAAHSAKVAYPQYQQPAYYDYSSPNLLQFSPSDGISNSDAVFGNKYIEPKSDYYQTDAYNANYKIEDEDFEDEDSFLKKTEGFSHYKTSSSVNLEGPHQIETIETKSFHKKVPKFDTSDFKTDHHHGGGHKKGEVHYHQHKHMHQHDHKQDHVHQHKQQHKHVHGSQHKHGHDHKATHGHSHHEDHKHGHDHKGQHEHKHSDDHKHGHEHHSEHKHNHHESHKHGHSHKHSEEHKHEGHHSHKHSGDHKHSHSSGHKHDHHSSHKHDDKHSHKHDGHHDHKHDAHHSHKHSGHHSHKHSGHHGHKHGHHHQSHSKHY